MKKLKRLYEKVMGKDVDRILINACKKGDLDKVKLCVELGVRIQAKDSALCCAADRGQLDIVKYLVEDTGAQSSRSLYWAASKGHLNVVRYLVEKGAKHFQRYNYNIALCWAISGGHSDVINYLKGAVQNEEIKETV